MHTGLVQDNDRRLKVKVAFPCFRKGKVHQGHPNVMIDEIEISYIKSSWKLHIAAKIKNYQRSKKILPE